MNFKLWKVIAFVMAIVYRIEDLFKVKSDGVPYIVGTVKNGTRGAFSYLFSDGSLTPHIAGAADEVTSDAGSVGEFVAAEIVSRLIIEAAYAEAIMPALVNVADISAEATLTEEFPKWPLMTATDLTEGTDAANAAMNATSVPITADEAGIMITVTDVLLGASATTLDQYATQLGKALANKIDLDVLAAASSFGVSVGSTGVNMTADNVLDSIYELENGNYIGDNLVAVLHPIQLDDLRKEISASTGSIWGNPSVFGQSLGALKEVHGVDLFRSTNCASVNTNADRQGVIMPAGQTAGLAFVLKEGARTEFQRDASLRATEIVVTAVYGQGCVNTAAAGGVSVITDHE
jgi:hypothetical protein